MNQKAHIFQTFAVLCAVIVFALCVFYTLVLSAGIYKRVSDNLNWAYASHTGINYIAAKIHSGDKDGGVEIGRLGDTPALMLTEEIDGDEYVTYIYCYESSLYELFCERDARLSPQDGIALLSIDSMEIKEISPGFIKFACSLGDERAQLCLALRSASGGKGQ